MPYSRTHALIASEFLVPALPGWVLINHWEIRRAFSGKQRRHLLPVFGTGIDQVNAVASRFAGGVHAILEFNA